MSLFINRFYKNKKEIEDNKKINKTFYRSYYSYRVLENSSMKQV